MLKDVRLKRVCEDLVSTQASKSSVIIHQLSATHSEEVRYGRFLSNSHFSSDDLRDYLLSSQTLAVKDAHVLSIQDSSEVNMTSRGDEDLKLGSIGTGQGYGYYIHPHLLLNADSGSLLGLGSLHSWIREDKRSEHKAHQDYINSLSKEEADNCRKERHHARMKDSRKKSIEEKEGYRWILSGYDSLSRLKDASLVTVVADCETDTYEYIVALGHADFARSGDPVCRVLVRSDNNRLLDIQKKVIDCRTGKTRKKNVRLYEHLRNSEVKQIAEVHIKASPNRAQRDATFALKYEKVKLRRPERLTEANAYLDGKKLPKFMEVTVVQFTEISQVPEGEKPINWTIITTHSIDNDEFALKIVSWYQTRWRIEMYFKNLKKTGFDIEKILNQSQQGILKLTFTTLMAAVRIIQLIQARENEDIPIESVFSAKEIQMLEILNQSLQGKTEKLRNPHKMESLAFATWVIARMGGWKGYASQRKPGAYTLKVGIAKFYHFKEAFYILDNTNKQ